MHTEYSTASSTCKAHDFHPNHEKYRSLRSLFLFRKYFSKFFPKTVDKRGHLWYSNPCQYPPVWWNGRHRRLKISRQQCRTGSSPVTGTIRYNFISRSRAVGSSSGSYPGGRRFKSCLRNQISPMVLIRDHWAFFSMEISARM